VLATARSPANVTPIAVGFCCVWRSGARIGTVSVPRHLRPALLLYATRRAQSHERESLQVWGSRSLCGTSRM